VDPLRQGIASHPESFELQIALGELYLDIGKAREAEIYLENAKALDADKPRLVKDFERLKNLNK
jgi:cytochrome c-type biogenesis protein CcmH/NrfG